MHPKLQEFYCLVKLQLRHNIHWLNHNLVFVYRWLKIPYKLVYVLCLFLFHIMDNFYMISSLLHKLQQVNCQINNQDRISQQMVACFCSIPLTQVSKTVVSWCLVKLSGSHVYFVGISYLNCQYSLQRSLRYRWKRK